MAFMPMSLALMLVSYLKLSDDKHRHDTMLDNEVVEKPKTSFKERIDKRKQLSEDLKSFIDKR